MIAIACVMLLTSQVLTGDDLRRAGLVRIADVLRLAEGWDVSTIEGFTLHGAPPGSPLPERMSYALFVDGVFVPLDQLGTTHLNRVPVSLEDVERVTIDSRPSLTRGRFAPGAIRIETKRPERGLELRARHVMGSETGDPGPFQFTELATPNVERFGFDSHATVGARSGGGADGGGGDGGTAGAGSTFWTNIGGRYARHYASDPLVVNRYLEIGGPEFHILEGEGAWGHGGWDGERTHAELFVRGMTIDEGFFLRPHGRELPVENVFEQVGASGTWRARKSLEIETSVVSTKNELDGSEHGGVPPLDWKSEDVAWEAELRPLYGKVALGGRATFRQVESDSPIDNDAWTLGAAWARLGGASSSPKATSLDLGVEWERGRFYPAALTALRRPWSRGVIEGSLSLTSQREESSSPFWYWHDRGLDILEEEGIAVDVDEGGVKSAATLAADLGGSWALGSGWTVEVNGFVRSLGPITIEDERFQYDADAETFTSAVYVGTHQDGVIAGGTLAASWDASASSHLRASWRYQDSAGGSALFQGAVRAASRHVARAAYTTTPFRNFDAELAVRARSETHWTAYEDVAAQSQGRYDDRLPAFAAVDVSFRKWLWTRRIRFGLAFRNLFDQGVRTHPIGENEALTVIAEAALQLPR